MTIEMREWEKHLREELLAAEETLTFGERARLIAARRRALETALEPTSRHRWLPFGGLLAASLLLALLVLVPAGERLENRLAAEHTEPTELGFYYWLAETQELAGS
ncbi:MAG: hypothetical protein KatS3mg124_1332 [Porticoccaceae bacterium]|nr:MAG: hypothetical protein KatS3mg124_1332 [Porticoccaceae bacterium]